MIGGAAPREEKNDVEFFSIFLSTSPLQKPNLLPPQIEAKTRAEIDEAKRSLRALVGDAYRDVLASADAIAAMKRDARRLVAATGALATGTAALSRSVAAEASSSSPAAAASSASASDPAGDTARLLFAVGARVRLITGAQYANTIKKLCEAAGVKDTQQFVADVPLDFSPEPPGPPQPSPDAIVNAKALTDMEQIKGQVAIQKQQMELAAQAQKEVANIQSAERMKLAELQSKETIALADIESRERIATGDLQVKTTANEIQAARAALEADAKQQSIDSGHLDRDDSRSAREDDKNGALAAAIEGMSQVIKQTNKSKRIVRDAKGKAVSVEAFDS